MKATSIFGGVQVFNIIISIVRSKFIAVLLGPIGIGISGMLTATTGIISGLTNFGLGTSAIRDISSAHETGNTLRLAIVAKVLKKLVWITGTLGFLTTLVLSPFLSYISFGNWDYTVAFMVLSVTLLLGQLNVEQLVMLQGRRKLSFLAKANVIGGIIGLFTTIPLYYVWGINGIVPALLISSFVALIISMYFNKKDKIENILVTKTRTFAEGKLMLKMGFMISMSGFITLGCSYIVRLYISNNGGIVDVGYYNAGFTIINTYVGIVFTAMGTDYYPRLSSSANDIEHRNKLINHQAEIALLILGPVIIIFIIFMKLIIGILYSNQFLLINNMLVWAAFGMLFKAVSWAIAFLFLAKASSKLFFWNELITNCYLVLISIIGFKYWGLTGLGVSFMLVYFIYMIQVYYVAKIKYGFKINAELLFILLFQLQFSILGLLFFYNLQGQIYYLSGIILVFANIIYSIKNLNRRINLKSILSKIRAKANS
jgi:O-antigen/teichoic acid export membrane protein